MKATHKNLLVPIDEKLCVLFEPASGVIVHTHRVTTFPGGRKIDNAEMEKRIRERAASRGRDVHKLSILHVEPKSYKLGAQYQVDVKTKKLVERPHTKIAKKH